MAETVSSFVKNHKVALILLGVSVLIYLVYDYFTAGSSSATSAQDTTDAADQAALTDQLAALQAGSSGGTLGTIGGSSGDSTGYTGGNIATSTPVSTGTAATDAANTASGGASTVSTGTPGSPGSTSAGSYAAPYTGSNPINPVTGQPIPTNLGVAIGGMSEQQEQAQNAISNATEGTPTANNAAAIYQGVLSGNASDILAENAYNSVYENENPDYLTATLPNGSMAVNETGQTNPFLAYLQQLIAGVSASPAQQTALATPVGTASTTADPTSGSAGGAGPSGGSSTVVSSSPVTSQTPTATVPSHVIYVPRPITTVPTKSPNPTGGPVAPVATRIPTLSGS